MTHHLGTIFVRNGAVRSTSARFCWCLSETWQNETRCYRQTDTEQTLASCPLSVEDRWRFDDSRLINMGVVSILLGFLGPPIKRWIQFLNTIHVFHGTYNQPRVLSCVYFSSFYIIHVTAIAKCIHALSKKSFFTKTRNRPRTPLLVSDDDEAAIAPLFRQTDSRKCNLNYRAFTA